MRNAKNNVVIASVADSGFGKGGFHMSGVRQGEAGM